MKQARLWGIVCPHLIYTECILYTVVETERLSGIKHGKQMWILETGWEENSQGVWVRGNQGKEKQNINRHKNGKLSVC